MREIRFRAWDKEEGIMYQSPKELRHLGSWLDGHLPGALANEENVVLLQYTGLNDKNGTPIYEGDIVKHFNSHWGHNQHQIFTVEWDETVSSNGKQLINCGWNFKPIHKGFSTCFVPSKDFEVIGNIYEDSYEQGTN